ncbi:MAG: DUF3795 domain-containing protein [Clostridia bacterium]|nr:DUF3795 domain-containing protein [Clostridia bacterium]
MSELIAYCGVDCAACLDYTTQKCPGCRQSEWSDGDPCAPIACCQKHGVPVCGLCGDFPCAMMQAFYRESDSHLEALARMETLRKGSL